MPPLRRDRTGVIAITHTVPAGTLVIADDPSETLLCDTVSGLCRLAYDNRTMLVPGIPEARSDDEPSIALQAMEGVCRSITIAR